MSDGDGLQVGAEALELTAPLVYPGGRTEEVSLSTLLSEGPVLLAFYTNDFSPDCLEEMCSFRDFEWFAESDTVRVVGISRSETYLHRRFISYLDLSFPLYADTDLEVAAAFGVH
jgi:peroxiredoxin